MKKILSMWMTLILMTLLLAGCGGDGKDSAENSEAASVESGESADAVSSGIVLKDLEVEKYVTLGEYKGAEVSVAAPTVEDTAWDEQTKSVYTQFFPAESGITERAVEMGDVVNIDYEGKRDGVAFDGGTATGYNLTIGSGSFIDGFEEGLVGVLPGETVDLNLSFPENYRNTDLAGQEVVFTVTVNYIIPAEMEDSVVAGLGIEGVSTVEDLRQYTYDYLYSVAEQNYHTSVENAVMKYLVDNSEFQEIPENVVAKYEETARTNIEAVAAANGVDVDTFTYYYYGMDFESFLASYVDSSVKQTLAAQAVANAENLNISDEELEEILTEDAAAAGYATAEEFLGSISREDYREYCMFEKVLAFLKENTVVISE